MGVILSSFFIQFFCTNESNRLASFVSPLFLLPFLHCSKGSRQRRIRKQMRNRTEQTDRFLLSRRGSSPFRRWCIWIIIPLKSSIYNINISSVQKWEFRKRFLKKLNTPLSCTKEKYLILYAETSIRNNILPSNSMIFIFSPTAQVRFNQLFEIPKLEKWFKSEPNPSRQKLINYMNTLNASQYRKSHAKISYQQVRYSLIVLKTN